MCVLTAGAPAKSAARCRQHSRLDSGLRRSCCTVDVVRGLGAACSRCLELWLEVWRGVQVQLMGAGVPWRANMLVTRNAVGKLPEDVASTHAAWVYLRKHRLRFEVQAAAVGDMPS